ncbi:TrkH family potassium uptake protein [Ruminococcus sp.]|uniref:TrkH family potassium uptake protein n=1 Tax=Ruminococcus sp. TaxID=41978 RepID=UPI00388D500E
MNKRLISYILGWVMLIEGAAMQLSTVVGLMYREWHFMKYFVYVGTGLAVLGALLVIKKPKSNVMYLKDGFAATAMSWLVLSLGGCLPLWISKTIPHFIDALFETISGFTTTGATILVEIEHLPRCMLFWRSFSHFLGGMGVVVFLLAIIPRLGGSQNINLMKAESTGPSVSKSMPKLRNYAALLYGIYGGLTLLECVLLLFGGMNLFDAVTTSFSTAGTGGFMVYNDSMARFSPYLQTVVAVFMMLFGVNFYVYILILSKRFKQAMKNEELWMYVGITLLITGVIAADLFLHRTYGENLFQAIHQSFFYITSVESSTGMAITDVNRWPELSKALVLIATCIGACAGSTGGGFKVSRFMILLKGVRKEFTLILHPRTVQTVKMDSKRVTHEVSRSVSVYFVIYMAIVIVTTILISLNGFDYTTSLSSVLATLNNTGPGMNIVGSTGNYAGFSVFSKIVFCFNMLAGRLELYPFLLIFIPTAWRKN